MAEGKGVNVVTHFLQLTQFRFLIGSVRRRGEQSGCQTNANRSGHDEIGPGPAGLIIDAGRSRLEKGRQSKSAGAGPNHCKPISGLISCR